MSLTQSLMLVSFLSLLGVGATVAVGLQLHRDSDAVREADAEAQAAAVAEQLRRERDALPAETVHSIARGVPPPAALKKLTASLLSTLGDASAGYCLPDGTLILRETVAPPHLSLPLRGQAESLRGNLQQASGLGLLPLDRDAIAANCSAQQSANSSVRLVAPRGTLFLAVRGGPQPFAAWALVRTAPPARQARALLGTYTVVSVIAISMIALVTLCVATVLRVSRGIRTITDAIIAAQTDLQTPVPQPAMRELRVVANGLRDMTSHLAEARIRELNLERRLSHEQRLAALGRVAAGIAHEVRNPLAGIKLRLDAMARRSLDERNAYDVWRSLAEVSRLDSVVQSLLLVARKDTAPRELLDFARTIEDRITALSEFAGERMVRFAWRCVHGGGMLLRLDGAAMTLVIDNLLRNGIEASPPGTAVTVELEREVGQIVMRVSDEGKGVAESEQAQLFEPFFTSKPDGTGLGLSLSRAAVEAHGGSLTYERAQGKTCFSVRLPIQGSA